MITIDQMTLNNLGIDLGNSTNDFLKHVEDQLEERVGVAVTELLSDKQLKELVQITESGKNDDAQTWIATQIPDYKDLVQVEVDILLGEIAASKQK